MIDREQLGRKARHESNTWVGVWKRLLLMGGVKQHVFSLSALRSKMGRYRRKRVHSNDKHLKKKYRTRRRTKDLDEIEVDLLTDGANIQRSDPDLPGSGQHYCIHCA